MVTIGRQIIVRFISNTNLLSRFTFSLNYDTIIFTISILPIFAINKKMEGKSREKNEFNSILLFSFYFLNQLFLRIDNYLELTEYLMMMG